MLIGTTSKLYMRQNLTKSQQKLHGLIFG